ncbi:MULTISPECIES: HsdM family class I SAM-dependent methyltransferase [Achromobacter]|uniref:site-specific DNA-methyltransferase (adenine-specific) n=1 Tax=Achromobacter spanius TaxID=217203 RepID=A0ABY8H120_9BURK|nr:MULTISPECIES: N-6 DNA methylase [Achromobacter]WAI85712.1 SAM-dependent methyltransferase [Achromobacter spanius]WEX95793.1 SAM-dependent methyltransferase [Achromobacter sp. SS2-2022]WFP10486.1 N-6 DNA methylase [Achromobacter spanius]
MNSGIDLLVDVLGYRGDDGLLQGRSDFARAIGSAHALHAAADSIKLQACFGAWEPGFGDCATARFVPIVYLAQADSVEEARQHHRWAWSQSLAPWLIVAVQGRYIICPGFDFPSEPDWTTLVVFVGASDLHKSGADSALKDFAAVRLRSSLQWRDFRLQSAGTVDRRLLRGLEHLHERLAATPTDGELPAAIINRLIGRVLYTFLLLDRGIVPGTWAQGLAQDGRSLNRIRPAIALAQFWELQDRIDDIFNGAVFVLDPDQRLKIQQRHLNLAIDYMRGGTTLHKGGEQTELFEIDLTAIQIETLSAVYEEFLRSESPASVRDDGIVYTPPFLVDFVLNRLDDEQEFSTHSRILDPTAGSGVFLVAAFRRIVERVLAERRLQCLPMEELRQILVQCIHGVEKAASAAAVAAFSLYLHLLEYADPAELLSIVTERRRPKVFPPLIGSNILVTDFFSAPRHFKEIEFTCVAGNPPWKPLERVTSYTVDGDDAVDGREASEHITWLSLRRYLGPDGMLGLVMPSKSISSPSAKTFLTALGQTFHVRAIVNLSQWRRHLFENAEQPAALLFVSTRKVTHASRTAFYSPAMWTQPFTPKAMWTLAIDCSDVQWMPSFLVFRDQENLFDAYALRPLDRAAKNRLRQAVSRGTATTFGKLLLQLGLVSAGGSTPARTLLRADEICNINDFAEYGEGFTTLKDHPKQLSEQRHKACSAQHRKKFQGERLLVSRSLAQALAVGFPLAVNSSMNVIHWKDDPAHLTLADRAAVLSKLGRFLMSDFARFQFALFGQLWQVDRTRVERRDLDGIVVPPPEYFLQTKDDAPDTNDFIAAMQVQDVAAAMRDYLETRLQFENGLTPAHANERIDKVPDDYLKVLSASLCGSFGTLFRGCEVGSVSESSARIVVDMAEPLPKSPAGYVAAFQFHDSARITWTEGERQIRVDKPAGRLNFSLDRAYSDALRVANLLLAAQ